jgi:general secretion pathway protein C
MKHRSNARAVNPFTVDRSPAPFPPLPYGGSVWGEGGRWETNKCVRISFLLPFLALVFSLLASAPAVGQDLSLRLVGTAVSDDSRLSYAIIEAQSSGQQKPYHEGDQLGEILIKKILLGKVVIQTPRGEALLSMRGVESGAAPSQARQTARLDRKEVDSALPDYSHLMQQIRVRPKFEGGRPSGFVIYNVEPGSIFARMGLTDGDVITAMNGRSFETTQPTMDFYEALKEGGAVSLDIKRGESSQKLNFEIR